MIFKLFLIVLQDLFQGYTYSLLNSTLLCMHEKNLWIHSLINFSFSIALSVSFIISTEMSGAWNPHGVCSHTTIGRRADLGSVCCHKHKRNLIWNHPRVPDKGIIRVWYKYLQVVQAPTHTQSLRPRKKSADPCFSLQHNSGILRVLFVVSAGRNPGETSQTRFEAPGLYGFKSVFCNITPVSHLVIHVAVLPCI